MIITQNFLDDQARKYFASRGLKLHRIVHRQCVLLTDFFNTACAQIWVNLDITQGN
ncbi:MAG: hypothetical protein ACJA10_000050 [Oleispira sp.]|jgi:hypothetical protein